MATSTRTRKTTQPKKPPASRPTSASQPAPIPAQPAPPTGGDLVSTGQAIPIRATDCRDIPLAQLVPDPARAGRALRGIPELADSFREAGVLEPLVVRPIPDPGGEGGGDVWVIVMGRRRYAAAQLVGLASLPCIVRDLDEAQAVQDALLSHLHHDSLSPVEEAEQLQRLMDLRALTVAALATAAGRSASFVSGRLALLALPAVALDALHEGVISVGDAGALTDLADYPEMIADLLEDIDEHGIDPYALKEARRRAATERDRDRLRAEATAKGLRLIDVPPRTAGYMYVANLELTPRQAAAHPRQSCHGVYLESSLGGSRLVPICSDPDRHRPKPTTPTGPASDADENQQTADPTSSGEGEDEARAQVRERKEELARYRAAQEDRERATKEDARNRKRVTTARREFLTALAGKKTIRRSDTLVFVFGSMIERASQATMTWVGGLLGLEASEGSYGEKDWRTPVAVYAASSGENLLKVAFLISANWAEDRINPHVVGYNAFVARYIELLAGFGYTPDPYEVEQIEHAHQDDIATHPSTATTDSEPDDPAAGGESVPQDEDQEDLNGEVAQVAGVKDTVRQITSGDSSAALDSPTTPDQDGRHDAADADEPATGD